MATGNWALLLFTPVAGYGFPAWVGHFFFEKNRPATFKHPFYSFMGDWATMKDNQFSDGSSRLEISVRIQRRLNEKRCRIGNPIANPPHKS